MASRPIFLPCFSGPSLVHEMLLEFQWAPGFAESQKRKNVSALHSAAKKRGIHRILEISSKSSEELGKRLSAFNLKTCFEGKSFFIESLYQGSKVFEQCGPFPEIAELGPREAKRFINNEDRGRLIRFELSGQYFPIHPKNAFYDWLYIGALVEHADWINEKIDYEAFTDIEFNPARQVNCQARAFAEYMSLLHRSELESAVAEFDIFVQMLSPM